MNVTLGPLRVAGVLDRLPGGPDDRAPIGDSERRLGPGETARVLERLDGGVRLYPGRFRDLDRFAPERGPVVPLDVRTDGVWAWSAASAYYLREYGVAPDPELVERRAAPRDRELPTCDELDELRAACDAFASRDARSLRFGFYVVWRGREWRSLKRVHAVPGELLSYSHPRALAFGFDLDGRYLRRVVPPEEFDDSYRVSTEALVRGEWVDVDDRRGDEFGVGTADGRRAEALGLRLVEPGLWRGTFRVDEIVKLRETRTLRHTRYGDGPSDQDRRSGSSNESKDVQRR